VKKADFCLGLLLIGVHFFSGCATERTTHVTKQEFPIGENEISESDVTSNVESGLLPETREGSSNQLKSPSLGQLKENRISVKESAEEVISVPLKENMADSFDRVVPDLNQSSEGSDDAGNDELKKFPNPVIELVEGGNHGSQPAKHEGVKHTEESRPGTDKSFQGDSEDWGNKFFKQNPNTDAVQNSGNENIYKPKTSSKSRLNELPNNLSRRVSVDMINPKPEADQSLSLGVKEKNQSPNANSSKQKIALSSEREVMKVGKKTESEELIENSPPKPLSSSINNKSEEPPSISIAYSQKEENGRINSEKEKSVVHLNAESSSFPETAIDAKSLELGNHSDHSPQIAKPSNEKQILLNDPLSAEISTGDSKVMQRVAINDSKNLRLTKDEVLRPTSKKLSDGGKNNFEKLQHFLSGKNKSGNPKENEQTRNYQKLKGWVPDGDDLNNSQVLEESNPKQFRHALDWIESKGRTQVE